MSVIEGFLSIISSIWSGLFSINVPGLNVSFGFLFIGFFLILFVINIVRILLGFSTDS